MSLKLHIGGVRGTCPAAGPAFTEFGGDTTAFLVESDQTQLVLDGGTGLHNLLPKLQSGDAAGTELTLLLSHFHFDHLQGLLVCPLIYGPPPVRILVPPHFDRDATDVLNQAFGPPFWPVSLSDQPAIRVELLEDDGQMIGDIRVDWLRVPHPGGSTAFRFKSDRSILVLVSDIELPEASADERANLRRFAAGADLLLMDGQYSDSEYAKYRGWGHGTWQQAAEFADEANVKRLVIAHHGPRVSDEVLRMREEVLKRNTPSACFARGGDTFEIGAAECDQAF